MLGLSRLRIGLLSSSASSIGGGGSFSPLSLFASGEQGAWYDPSDLSTMFQDTAGTTPVTATGQTVGLLLDKSKGLVLGPELVTNGDFSNGSTGWTGAGDSFSISGGVATLTRTTTFTYYQGTVFNVVAGRSYWITGSWLRSSGTGQSTVQVRENATGVVRFQQDGTPGAAFQPFQWLWTPTVTETVYVRVGVVNAAATVQFDAISVKELPGNHATQATAASRPIYGIEPFGGRRNLLTFTEQFDNAAWLSVGLNTTVTGNTTTAPNNTDTADTLRETTDGGSHYIATSTAYVTFISGTNYTYSIYVKKGDGSSAPNIVQLSLNGTYFGTSQYANYNISTGVVTSSTGGTAAIESSENGWYRISWTATATSGGTGNVSALILCNNNPASVRLPSYVGSTTSNVFIWGAQLELGSTATPYQRVTDQWNVTQAGVPSVSYIQCDGTDDFLLTGTITPGIDKAQVFAGVRKLSDAATGVVLETSSNAGANNGVIDVQAPSGAAANYRFGSRGTIGQAGTASGFAAPITNVLTGIGDIAGDVATLRINGAQVATSAADQGTGNYLAYPLYIGRRGGTTLPFNGRIYQMIVRFGANLSAAQISQMETWLNARTGAF